VLDFWLTGLWQRLGCPDIRYIQIPWMMANREVPTSEEVTNFRSAYKLPLHGPCEKVPLAGLLNTGGDGSKGGNHYCCAIWRPEEKVVHVLGRRYASTGSSLDAKDWEEWGGPIIWRNLTILHGWGHIPLSIRTLDWIQNGYDCGPIACQVLESVWTSGFELTSRGIWKKPVFPCCHPIRLRITSDVHAQIMDTYEAHCQQPLQDAHGILDEVIKELENHPARRLLQTTNHLERAISKCSPCISLRPKTSQNASQKKPSMPSFINQNISHAKGMPGYDPQSDGQDSDSGQSSSDITPATANRNIHVTDWSQARLGRFCRPPAPALPPLKSLRGLWSSFDDLFDEYEEGPTLEDLASTAPPVYNCDLVYMANQIIKNPWTMFKDQGYRLLPSYADLFHKKPPIMILEHISPVGISHPSSPDHDSDDDLCAYDAHIMGAGEMLQAADAEDNDLMFLTGKTFNNQYICLDLQRDAIKPEDIHHSYDIDSLICVTIEPRFNHAVNVFTMPHIRKKAPIWKHNHVYIDLLVPQSENDRLSHGPRSEWWTRRFRMSQIPHVSFGHLGEGSGSVNVYLFFPRMTHKPPHSARWISLVPPDVQNFFWKNVMTPAMKEVTTELDQPYVGLSRENLVLKMGSWSRRKAGEGRRAPTFPFQPAVFRRLIAKMMEIVGFTFCPSPDQPN
jgi:hypothetical protein